MQDGKALDCETVGHQVRKEQGFGSQDSEATIRKIMKHRIVKRWNIGLQDGEE